MRLLPIASIFAILVSCGGGGVEGTLKDEAGNPLADVTITLTAASEVGMTCQKFGAPTDAEGKFKIDGVCTGETAYNIKTDNDSLWLGASGTIPAGHDGVIALVAINSGGGPGVYHYKSESEVSSIRSGGDLKKTVAGETEVWYSKKAQHALVVPAGESLLINGPAIDTKKFHTMTYAPGPLKLGTEDAPVEVAEGAGIWIIGCD